MLQACLRLALAAYTGLALDANDRLIGLRLPTGLP
jgi:hypothetical protein